MITLAPNVEAGLASYKARLVAELGPRLKRLVLFGSVARGEARWDSDVDVLVLLDRVDGRERGHLIDLAADELSARDVLISPIIMSESEFHELEARERLLPKEIAREGIAL